MEEWISRLNILKDNIQQYINSEPNEEINEIKLFYNEVI